MVFGLDCGGGATAALGAGMGPTASGITAGDRLGEAGARSIVALGAPTPRAMRPVTGSGAGTLATVVCGVEGSTMWDWAGDRTSALATSVRHAVEGAAGCVGFKAGDETAVMAVTPAPAGRD